MAKEKVFSLTKEENNLVWKALAAKSFLVATELDSSEDEEDDPEILEELTNILLLLEKFAPKNFDK